MNFIKQLFDRPQAASMPFNPAGAPAMPMPQAQGNFQQMTQGAPDASRVAEILQAIGGNSAAPPVQMPEQQMQQPQEQSAPRPRRSFLDTVGQISDVLARVGGAEALYQPTLDAREDRTRQISLEELQNQQREQQLAIGDQTLEAGEMELGDSMRGRAAQALGALAGNPEAAALWPQVAAQAGLDEQMTAQVGQLLQTGQVEAGTLAQALGLAPPKAASQAKEVQLYQMLLEEGGPEMAQAYLQSITNPDSMTPKQQADLAIATARLGLEEDKFAYQQDRDANPPETASERNARAKIEATRPKVAAAFRSATNDIDKQIRELNELRNHEGLAGITGAIEGRMGFSIRPSSNAAQALLDTILARGGFNALQEMRNNSPTGGALGSVSNAEGERLQNSVASLNTAQDKADFQKAIDKYIGDLQFSKANLSQAFEETYTDNRPAPREAPARTGSGRAGANRGGSGRGRIVSVGSAAEARNLPSGTRFRTPDGRVLVKR